MTVQVSYTLTINTVIDELFEFLDSEELLADILVELFDEETILTILQNLLDVLEWLDAFLQDLQEATIALDSAFAFLEMSAEVIDFLSGQLRQMGQSALSSGTDFLQEMGSFLNRLPDIDTSAVNSIGGYLPEPDDIINLRQHLQRLISTNVQDPGIMRSLINQIQFNTN